MGEKVEALELEQEFPVPAGKLYKDWLNSSRHTAFTGGVAIIHPEEGSAYEAWDGYIAGRILELEEGKRMLFTWRSSEFSADDSDSLLEVVLEEKDKTCLLKLRHWNIPAGQAAQYLSGWKEHYFEPMLGFYKRA